MSAPWFAALRFYPWKVWNRIVCFLLDERRVRREKREMWLRMYEAREASEQEMFELLFPEHFERRGPNERASQAKGDVE